MQNNDEITELVQALQRNGDNQAFNKLVGMFQDKIYNLSFNFLKHPEEAKDITQDVFVTVYRSLHTLRDASKFPSWLYQIAINHCRNRYKSLKKKGYYSSVSFDDQNASLQLATKESPGENLERRDMIMLVRNTIADMPEPEKEILMLRDIQELSYEEMSAVLQLPLGTIKSRLNRARISLKNRLQHYFNKA